MENPTARDTAYKMLVADGFDTRDCGMSSLSVVGAWAHSEELIARG